MFPLGHVGIGTHLVPRAVRDKLPWRWLAFGCLLPDLHVLMVASSPLRELAAEMQNRVYIAGEVVGAGLLLWDVVRWRRSGRG